MDVGDMKCAHKREVYDVKQRYKRLGEAIRLKCDRDIEDLGDEVDKKSQRTIKHKRDRELKDLENKCRTELEDMQLAFERKIEDIEMKKKREYMMDRASWCDDY